MQQWGLDVAAISSPGPLLHDVAREGIQTHGIRMLRRVSPWCDLKALFALRRVLRAEAPDIVHTHTPKAGLLGMLSAWTVQVPIRIHTYAGAPYDGRRGLSVTLAKLADRLTALMATEVWSVGHELSTYLEAERIVKPGRLQIIGAGSSNGIDLQEFVPIARDCPQQPPRFIWIGRLAADKGLDELMVMWAIIREELPRATLEIVGELDERDPVAADLATRLQCDDRVQCVGFQLDIAKRLPKADVLLFTSRREGLPGVVLQAQAASVPVIALRCRGATDALVDGLGGRIFERDAIGAAGRTAVDLIRQVSLWQAYRIAGRRFVLEHFERNAFHQAVFQRYREHLRQHDLAISSHSTKAA